MDRSAAQLVENVTLEESEGKTFASLLSIWNPNGRNAVWLDVDSGRAVLLKLDGTTNTSAAVLKIELVLQVKIQIAAPNGWDCDCQNTNSLLVDGNREKLSLTITPACVSSFATVSPSIRVSNRSASDGDQFSHYSSQLLFVIYQIGLWDFI